MDDNVSKYNTTLKSCECKDFIYRNHTCKHIDDILILHRELIRQGYLVDYTTQCPTCKSFFDVCEPILIEDIENWYHGYGCPECLNTLLLAPSEIGIRYTKIKTYWFTAFYISMVKPNWEFDYDPQTKQDIEEFADWPNKFQEDMGLRRDAYYET